MNQETSPIRRIFDAVIQAPVAKREDLLNRLCNQDADLMRRVREMIAMAESDDPFLNAPTRANISTTAISDPTAPITERAGTRIGPYKLLQQIGEGGFGTVFMAEQERPVRRRVALKIIKLGMDTRQVVARFEAERQALALMDHPHIARVLDAGATD